MKNTLQHLQQILCFMLMWPTSCVESLKMRSQTQTVDPEGLFIQGFNTTELMLHILFRDDRPAQAQSSLITRTSVTLGSTEETVHHHSSATIIRAFLCLSWWGFVDLCSDTQNIFCFNSSLFFSLVVVFFTLCSCQCQIWEQTVLCRSQTNTKLTKRTYNTTRIYYPHFTDRFMCK